jgi:hypothetical protein
MLVDRQKSPSDIRTNLKYITFKGRSPRIPKNNRIQDKMINNMALPIFIIR